MNVYGILTGLAIMALLAGWGSWETGKVDKLQGQMDSLKASYATAADKARLDAQQKEAAALDALNRNSAQAIADANAKAIQSQTALKAYQLKLAEASKAQDWGHKCSAVVIPQDLLPQQ